QSEEFACVECVDARSKARQRGLHDVRIGHNSVDSQLLKRNQRAPTAALDPLRIAAAGRKDHVPYRVSRRDLFGWHGERIKQVTQFENAEIRPGPDSSNQRWFCASPYTRECLSEELFK